MNYYIEILLVVSRHWNSRNRVSSDYEILKIQSDMFTLIYRTIGTFSSTYQTFNEKSCLKTNSTFGRLDAFQSALNKLCSNRSISKRMFSSVCTTVCTHFPRWSWGRSWTIVYVPDCIEKGKLLKPFRNWLHTWYTGFQNGLNALFRNAMFWNVADGPVGKLVFQFNQFPEALSLCGSHWLRVQLHKKSTIQADWRSSVCRRNRCAN